MQGQTSVEQANPTMIFFAADPKDPSGVLHVEVEQPWAAEDEKSPQTAPEDDVPRPMPNSRRLSQAAAAAQLVWQENHGLRVRSIELTVNGVKMRCAVLEGADVEAFRKRCQEVLFDAMTKF